MFPLDNKEPYIKANGSRSTLGEMFDEAGADVAQVKAALDNEIEVRAALGAHNLLPLSLDIIKKSNTAGGTWSDNVFTSSGVTFTINTDAKGNVTGIDVGGEYSSTVYFNIFSDTYAQSIKKGNYILTGKNTSSNLRFYIKTNNDGVFHFDEGNGSEFTVTQDTTYPCTIAVRGSFTPVTIYPMIRLADDADTTFTPYAMTNRELSQYSKSSNNGIIVERLGRMVHLYTNGVISTSYVVGETIVSDAALRTKAQFASLCILRDAVGHTYAAHFCYIKTDGTVVFTSDTGTNITDTTDFDYCAFDIMYFI